MSKLIALLAVSILFTSTGFAQTSGSPQGWDDLQFMMGEWVGEGSGSPGEGAGGFTFASDLQGKILVRKNYAVYPKTADRPAFRHDDLMIVYREQSGTTKAIYFDNEGHVIPYAVSGEKGKSAVFVSDSNTAGPRFRLTYTSPAPDSLRIQFDIAPPGKPNAFSPYITARAHRKDR